MNYISDEFGEEVDPPDSLDLLCGATASFDYSSGISYICNTCLCVVGSVSMPAECKEIYEADEIVRKLKGIK
jgi:hypothetical protein